jgi:hypothetical protein
MISQKKAGKAGFAPTFPRNFSPIGTLAQTLLSLLSLPYFLILIFNNIFSN